MQMITHNGTVRTDEVFSPGYVWLRCDAWGLPDNTYSKTGWHIEYRPLNTMYTPAGTLPDAALTAIREHYDATRQDDSVATIAALERADRVPEHVKALASKYGTAAKAWEAEDEQAWALLNNHGY